MKSKIFINLTIIFLGVFLVSLPLSVSMASFTDHEEINENNILTGTLDITLTSGQNNFVSGADDLQPGDSVARDIYITAEPNNLPVKHSVSYNFASGSAQLCDSFNLKIWYNHYHGPVFGGYANRDVRLAYDGPLSSLSDFQTPDFTIPHPDDEYDSNSSDGLTQWYYYQISLPPITDLDPLLQNQSCDFDFIVNAWQEDQPDNTLGFTDTESISSSLQTGTWEEFNPPSSFVSSLASIQSSLPFDLDYTAGDDTAVSQVELYYSYQSGPWIFYLSDNPSPSASVSGTFSFVPPHPDGVYQFRTIATDIFSNTESKTTLDQEILLDTIAPIITASLGEFDSDRTPPSYLENFDFEVTPTPPVDPLDPWISGIQNPAQLQTTPPAWSALRGTKSVLLNVTDPTNPSFLSSTFSIPVTSDDTLLSFWYNLNLLHGSDSSAFTVKVFETTNPSNQETILIHASDNPALRYISDWQELSFQLTAWHGKDVTIEFSLADTSVVPDAQVLIDDITLTSTPHTISTDKLVIFNSYDYGSGFLLSSGLPLLSEYRFDSDPWTQITGPIDPPAGPHTLYYRTTDEAGHSSGEHKLDLINHELTLAGFISPPQDATLSGTPTNPVEPAICEIISLETDQGSLLDLCVNLLKINDGQSVKVTISSLPENEQIEYQLIYLYDGQEQAIFANETLPVLGNTILKEFELATCSGQDCIYHNPDQITLDIIVIKDQKEYSGQHLFNL